jgi:putative cell wall-binding protein
LTSGAVTRIGGADRYITAADLSRASFFPGEPVVFVATGLGFADALAAAAALRSPVLLARPTCLPAGVTAELERLNSDNIVVLGGTSAMSDAVRQLTPC